MSSATIQAIRPVKYDIRRFVKFAWTIYRENDVWVPSLISEQVEMICQGRYLEEDGVIQPFLAFRDGEIVGRIIAHYDRRYNSKTGEKRGCFGFFECKNDPDVSRALFDAAAGWLKSQGMDDIFGPVNFQVYDASGLLVDGFGYSPCIDQAYNPPYYENLLTSWGFEKDVDWYAYRADNTTEVPAVVRRIRDRMRKKYPELEFKTLDMKKIPETARRFKALFNLAWEGNQDHLDLTDKQFDDIAKKLKMIVRPELVMYVEDNGELVGMFVAIPDVNQALKNINGRLFPFGIFRFLRGLKRIDGVRVYIMGIHPDYRDRGIETHFYMDLHETAIRLGYREADMSLIVESNNNFIGVLDKYLHRYKTYRFYRKSLS